jgi:hypothetical protein
VALRACTVSFTGPSGVRHSAEVTAESIYEDAALGVSALKAMVGLTRSRQEPSLRFRCASRPPVIGSPFQQIRRRCDGVAVSPDETLKKRRLKQLLA